MADTDTPAVSQERQNRALARSIHTVQPGYIESYDPKKRTVSAKPVITDYQKTDGEEPINLDWGVIPDCPVWYLGGGGAVFAPPLKKGDPCLIIHCQRSIDEWWQSDGQTDVTPVSQDTHTESDCIVLAGLLMPQQAIVGEANDTDVIISYKGAQIRIAENGEVQIKAPKVRMGTLEGNRPLALGDTTDDNLETLKSKVNALLVGWAAANLTGGMWMTPAATPIALLNSVKSDTVKANA